MSTPEPTTCAAVPPLFAIFQRCAVLSAHSRSNPATPVGAPTSGNFSEPPAQESRSFPSFEKHKLALPAAFLKQTVSAEASRKMPLVAGEAVPLMNVPVNGDDPPPEEVEP